MKDGRSMRFRIAPRTESAGASPRNERASSFLIVVVCFTYFALASRFNFSEHLNAWAARFEFLQVDELPGTLLVLSVGLIWLGGLRLRDAHDEAQVRQKLLLDVREAREDLVRISEENRRLARRAIDLQESERREIAREMHDELGQYFHAIRMELGAISTNEDHFSAELIAALRRVEMHIEHVYGVTRRILGRLRPSGLDEIGLDAALTHLLDGWRASRPDIRFQLNLAGDCPGLNELERIALFRVAQEALTNSARHAKPRVVTVGLAAIRHGADAVVELSISDDGCGIREDMRSGMGLAGMRERMEGIGGTISISTTAGAGTTVLVRTCPDVRN
ncbi:MAG TPA: histidine kinase [Burkholderiaceae bacterium]|nr:histidine kinase [Burkholderiaceae bacterium]